MPRIQNPRLAELLMQLRFAPQKKRFNQLRAAERLFGLLEADKQYPFEFVCYHITGYRPKDARARRPINGDRLIADLRVFIEKLSGRLKLTAEAEPEKIYTVDALAAKFNVSAKTIHRWRAGKNLPARKYVTPGGKKRLGFAKSTVRRFAQQNPDLIQKASQFSRLTKKQKQSIVQQAAALARNRNVSRRKVIQEIASRFDRAEETVRSILAEYQKNHAEQPVFSKPFGALGPDQASRIYQLYTAGASVRDLTKQFSRSKSSIYRLIRQRRAKELFARKIEFIPSDEFLAGDATETILRDIKLEQESPSQARSSVPLPTNAKNFPPRSVAGLKDSLPQYLESLKNIPLLTRHAEQDLFRKYNFLKYLGSVGRSRINPARPAAARIDRVEQYLARAEEVKNKIVEANLRLVISIAKKHLSRTTTLLELISEGNLALMHAVEKFDYTRGFRFSTYASWAITKAFARSIPAEAGRPDRAGSIGLFDVQRDMRTADAAKTVAVEDAHRSLEQVIRLNLDQREQYVIIHHFGLLGSTVKKQTKTLKQIGEELHLSKERTRQIELLALQKLRHCLSAEEFDLLTR